MVITLIALFGLAVAGWAIGSVNQDEAAAAFLPPVEQPAGRRAPRRPDARCS